MDQLFQDLRDAGYQVVPVGSRYRVTNPDGGAVTTLPGRLPRNAKFAGLLPSLKAIGFDPEVAAVKREEDRQKRLAADRDAAAAAMQRAENMAKANPAPSEVQQERKRTADRLQFADAPVPIESGPRTDFFDEFDAAFALDLLQTNHWFTEGGEGGERTNRKFSQEIADRYADEMFHGRWRRNHQGIGLDVNYVLVDGQHRLAALVQAADRYAEAYPDRPPLTIPLAVTYNLPPEAGQTVDMGLRRQNQHVLGMEGEPNAMRLAAISRLVAFYRSGAAPGEWANFQVSALAVVQLVRENPRMRDAARLATSKATQGIILPAALGAARFLIEEATDPSQVNKLEEFFTALRTGAGLERGSPILALRDNLTRQRLTGKSRRGLEHLALTIKAWNAWVAGETRTVASFRNTEPMPRVTALKGYA